MAIKRTIDEFCSACGTRQVRFRDDGLLSVTLCQCKPAPGPPDPPRILRASDVLINRQPWDDGHGDSWPPTY